MISKVRVKNFKAIQDSGEIDLINLNAFIGNNGSGKSSILEALQLLHEVVKKGSIDEAFSRFGSLEEVRNNKSEIKDKDDNPVIKKTKNGFEKSFNAIEIWIQSQIGRSKYEYEIHINSDISGDRYVVEYERLKLGNKAIYIAEIQQDTQLQIENKSSSNTKILTQNRVVLFEHSNDSDYFQGKKKFYDYISSWQFLSLNHYIMGIPTIINRGTKITELKSDGSNIADLLNKILVNEPTNMVLIMKKMEKVLPYISDLRSNFAKDIHRKLFLEMTEKGSSARIPGWLLSSGTVRILTYLSVLNQANPPSVLFIEEIENGLDPQTLDLFLSEIKRLNESLQVIFTSHSVDFLNGAEIPKVYLIQKDKESKFTVKEVSNKKSGDFLKTNSFQSKHWKPGSYT